MIRAMIRPDRL